MSTALSVLCVETGVGSGALGAELLGWRVFGYVERDANDAARILPRIREGVLPDAPVFVGDLFEFVGCGFAAPYHNLGAELVLFAAGFDADCVEGRCAGVEACLRVVGPAFAFVEGDCDPEWRDRVLGVLATFGYDAEWDCLPASACGAPHPRERCWIVAQRAVDGGAGAAVAGAESGG